MQLGLIEGFYGPPWSWAERDALLDHLADAGYAFWHYAPKADPGVRGAWREGWSDEHAEALRGFGERCRARGLRFGIGLTPVGLSLEGPPADRAALEARLAELDAIGIDDLLLGFDDLRGDDDHLAAEQARIVDWAAARTTAAHIVVCPTYYSDDPLLDRLFGSRPEGYLEALGKLLDARVGVYWAGEEICAREIGAGHIDRVAEQLRRAPVLWDNYPVNDSERMAEHLHLRAFTGRPAALEHRVAAHAINPALQPVLSAIPARTLADRYRQGSAFEYTAAFRAAARSVLGNDLAARVEADLGLLEDTGRDRLGERAPELRERYAGIDHPAAREIVRWLDGGYRPEEAAPGG